MGFIVYSECYHNIQNILESPTLYSFLITYGMNFIVIPKKLHTYGNFLIHWERDPVFPGKDLTTKQKDKSYFVVTCLCRNIHNAPKCAEWYFDRTMGLDGNLRFTDGQVKCTRFKIDSRNSDCTYLLLDGMKEPFDLIDPKSNFNQFRIFF